jgi:hypothetical protein
MSDSTSRDPQDVDRDAAARPDRAVPLVERVNQLLGSERIVIADRFAGGALAGELVELLARSADGGPSNLAVVAPASVWVPGGMWRPEDVGLNPAGVTDDLAIAAQYDASAGVGVALLAHAAGSGDAHVRVADGHHDDRHSHYVLVRELPDDVDAANAIVLRRTLEMLHGLLNRSGRTASQDRAERR